LTESAWRFFRDTTFFAAFATGERGDSEREVAEGMAFRRQRDEWDEFLSRHGPELQACGIPDFVVAKKMRFLVFLDHGYDEWGRAENDHAFFDARVLSDEQIARLAELVGRHIDPRYTVTVGSRWQRSA
jgi:hypothetical protein